MTKPNGIGRTDLWSQPESVIAADIWQRQFAEYYGEEHGPRGSRERVLQLIASEIGRTRDSVANRFILRGPTFGSMSASPRHAPSELVAERERRVEASYRRNITSAFFGDPPPGYSALDRRGQ